MDNQFILGKLNNICDVVNFSEATLGDAINQFSDSDIVLYYEIVHLLESEKGINYKSDILELSGNKAVVLIRAAINTLVKPGALIKSDE